MGTFTEAVHCTRDSFRTPLAAPPLPLRALLLGEASEAPARSRDAAQPLRPTAQRTGSRDAREYTVSRGSRVQNVG